MESVSDDRAAVCESVSDGRAAVWVWSCHVCCCEKWLLYLQAALYLDVVASRSLTAPLRFSPTLPRVVFSGLPEILTVFRKTVEWRRSDCVAATRKPCEVH